MRAALVEGDEKQPNPHLYQKAEGIGSWGACSNLSGNRPEPRESNGMRGIDSGSGSGNGSVFKLGGACR